MTWKSGSEEETQHLMSLGFRLQVVINRRWHPSIQIMLIYNYLKIHGFIITRKTLHFKLILIASLLNTSVTVLKGKTTKDGLCPNTYGPESIIKSAIITNRGDRERKRE